MFEPEEIQKPKQIIILVPLLMLVAMLVWCKTTYVQQVPDAQIKEWVQLIKRGEINHTERVYTFSFAVKLGAID